MTCIRWFSQLNYNSSFCKIFKESLRKNLTCLVGSSLIQDFRNVHNSSLLNVTVWLKKPSLCSSCQQEKSCKLRFLSHKSKLYLIENLLWFLGSFICYFCSNIFLYVAFINDYTRYTWFYPLCKRSDFYSLFLWNSKNCGNTVFVKHKDFSIRWWMRFVGRILIIISKIVAYYIICHVPEQLNRTLLLKESTDASRNESHPIILCIYPKNICG